MANLYSELEHNAVLQVNLFSGQLSEKLRPT